MTKKITKLTVEQESLMPIVRDDWINRAFSGQPMDREAVRAGILWMYDLAKQPHPNFCFVDSPLAAQIAANIFSGGRFSSAVDSAVYSAVRSAVDSAVYSAVYSAVRSAVDSAVRSAVDSAVYSAVYSAVDSAVDSAVYSAVYSAVDSAVYSAVRSAVDSAVRSAVDSAVGSPVDSAVGSAVYSAVDSAVYSAVYSAVRSAVDSAVRSAVRSAVDSAAQLRPHSWFGWAGTWLYGFASYADFFHRIGAIDVPTFREWSRLLKAHCWDAILLDNGWAVLCECPKYTKKDELGRLHCTTGPAVEWGDTWKLYYINGVSFDEEMFRKVTSNTMTAKEILAIEVIDRRVIALKMRGIENLLDEIGAKHLHSSQRGNHLYQIDDVFPETEYALKYSCPSTGRVYVSFVDQDIARRSKNADHCMAWKHRMTPEQYAAMPIANEA